MGNKDIVVLVDENDRVVGYGKKFATHKNPVPLHRAISVVIFNPGRTKMLLQQRAASKSTWPLFLSNACCTHPLPGEDDAVCAARRLKEEMGFETPLRQLFKFVYEVKYDEIWGEHELDTVFEGVYDGEVNADAGEAAGYKWMDVSELKKDIEANGSKYTPWLKIILGRMSL